MSQPCTKKLAVISNTSARVTNNKRDLDEQPLAWDLKIVKCIIWNIKINQSNKRMLALLDLGSKANLISWAYIAQLPLQVLHTS